MTKEYKLSEYTTPEFLMVHVDLTIDLTQNPVVTTTKLRLKANPNSKETTQKLVLNGQNMQLKALSLNQVALKPEEYELSDESLTIKQVPRDKEFTLESTCTLGINTDLFGLYETENTVLVKAETEGLRRVFFCIDRPDNLALYTTTIIAPKAKYPTLLSNGVLKATKELAQGKHSATWEDNFPKPSYLFSMVAGNLQPTTTEFTTKSGRKIPIIFHVPAKNIDKCAFAKEVLLRTLAWDEETFSIECYLQQYMIAGVDRYASGASETAGLNLFNTENLFATEATKTDLGIMRVLEVLAHECAHNGTGNRTTIANWFNLAWKEGLTSLRAELFCEQLFGEDIVRLFVGKNFDERAPRPDSYTAVRSLYTSAAYEKSANIFRMIRLILGEKEFNQSLSAFLLKHTAAAVTVEDFLNHVTMQEFLPWFTQTTIPTVSVTGTYNSSEKKYILQFKTKDRKNRPIPVVMGLLHSSGKELVKNRTLLIDADEQTFVFDNIPSKPIPSLLRGFSAPVHLVYNYGIDELLILMQFDSNIYNRCKAAKDLISLLVTEHCYDLPMPLTTNIITAYQSLFKDTTLNPWLLAEILTIPSEEELISNFTQPNFEKIAEARASILLFLAHALQPKLLKMLADLQKPPISEPKTIGFFSINAAGRRRLLALVCSYLSVLSKNNIKTLLVNQFNSSVKTNMTNSTNALIGLCNLDAPEADKALHDFYQHWQQDTNSINYWFKIQAANHSPTVTAKVKQLLQDSAYDMTNPNKVSALIGSFIKNPYGFHATSGMGYELVTDVIIQLDKINPTLAARLTENFVYWDLYDDKRQRLMLEYLTKINNDCSSADVKNMAKKGLDKQHHTSETNGCKPV